MDNRKKLSELKNIIINTGRKACSHGLIVSTDGNISARVNSKSFIITPAGMNKGSMKAGDLVTVGMNGKVMNGINRPSSEFRMHLRIYAERSDIKGICHLHPPYATAFAVCGISLDGSFLSEAVIAFGKAPLVEYATPGTEELFDKLRPYLQNADSFLLANHGALTIGSSVLDAYSKMETLEHTAKILCIARQLGKTNKLKKKEVKKLIAMRKKFE